MGFDLNFDFENINKKEVISYGVMIGYLLLGQIGYKKLYKEMTLIAKNKATIN